MKKQTQFSDKSEAEAIYRLSQAPEWAILMNFLDRRRQELRDHLEEAEGEQYRVTQGQAQELRMLMIEMPARCKRLLEAK